jgi:glutamate-1-semialdehyde 2,1-aminomutase
MTESAREFRRASRVMPGGVNSPVRSFRAVGGTPRVIARAEGATLIDVDGRRYVDYLCSWGAAIAGHAHPRVVEAVSRASGSGLSFGAPTASETRLAERVIERAPGVEMVRLVNSGTEAVMSAVRLARAATGRERILKFEGGYHGHADAMLVRAGSGAATLGHPDSPGVTRASAADTLVAPYNDLGSVERIFATHGGTIAGVVVEPIAGNMGVVKPAPGFLEGLRTLTRRHGSLLIFDEVMTGFRVSHRGAAGLLGVTPDLSAFGKIIGGGMPIGAYAGSRNLLRLVSPEGGMYQAGTFSGNPVSVAAGLATLELLDAAAYTQLEAVSSRLETGLRAALEESGLQGAVTRVGSMLTLFLGIDTPHSFAEVQRVAEADFRWVFHGMLSRGVHLPPGAYESWFVSLAHDDEAINRTVESARATLLELMDASVPSYF